VLAPSSAKSALWRQDWAALLAGGFQLAVVGLFYLMLGHAVFRRRDA